MFPTTSEVMVYFKIVSDDLSPDFVTQKLELMPTRTHERGDRIGPETDRTWDFSAWYLETDYQESFDVNDQLEQILSQLRGKEEAIDELYEKYEDLMTQFVIVIIINEGQTPALYFDSSVIAFAHRIRADFDIDMYANPYEEDEDDYFSDESS